MGPTLRLSPPQRVYSAFLLYAMAIGGIFPRLGDLQLALGLSEKALGLALIGTASGTMVSLTLAGPWLERLGHRAVLLAGIPLIALAYALASHASGPLALYLLLLPAGLCIGAVEIVVNLEADRVEHQLGQRIMSRAHAFWSIGFFSAGLLGAGVAQLGVPVQAHLLGMVVLIAAGCIWLLRGFEAADHRPHSHAGTTPRWARPSGSTLMLVAATLAAMVLEGAGAEWSAIYMRDVFGATPFLAGAAVAVCAGMQAAARWVADGFVERHGPLRVARTLQALLGTGAALVLLAPHPLLGLLGFGLIGVGTSAMFPLAMSAAAQATDRPAALNVAALAQTSFIAFLLGPPLLGWVATSLGIRWSFGITLPLVALAWWACTALAPRRGA
ncbi:MAG: MFS transporter [Pseudomonadota bacterium]